MTNTHGGQTEAQANAPAFGSLVVFLSVVFIALLLPTPASALEASDLCTGNPCVIPTGQYALDPFTFLDFSGQDVVLQGALGIFDGNTAGEVLWIVADSFTVEETGFIAVHSLWASGGSVAILTSGDINLARSDGWPAINVRGAPAGSITLNSDTGSVFGPAPLHLQGLGSETAGILQVNAFGDIDLQGAIDASGGTAMGGTATFVGSNIAVIGTLDVSSGEVSAGGLNVTGSGDVTFGLIEAGGSTTGSSGSSSGSGGQVSVSAAGDIQFGSGLVLSSGASGTGGSVVAQGDNIAVIGTLDLSSTGGDGGSVDLDAQGDMSLGSVLGGAGGESGEGGEFDLTAGGDVMVSGSISALGSLPSDPLVTTCGDGGDLDLFAGGALVVQGDISLQAQHGNCFGGPIWLQGDSLDIQGTLNSSSLTTSGRGGSASLVATSDLTFQGAANVSGGAYPGVISASAGGNILLQADLQASGGVGGYVGIEAGGLASVSGSINVEAQQGSVLGGATLLSACGLMVASSIDAGGSGVLHAIGSDSLDVSGDWTASLMGGITLSYGPNASPPTITGTLLPAPVLDLDSTLFCSPVSGDDDDSAGDDDDSAGDDDDATGDDDDSSNEGEEAACGCVASPASSSPAGLLMLLLPAVALFGRRFRATRSERATLVSQAS